MDKTKRFSRILAISVIAFLVYSLGILPIILFGKIILLFISSNSIWHFFILAFLIYIGILITLFYELLFVGLVIHIFNLKYKPGIYDYNYQEKMAFKWILVCSLYTPLRKILEIFPVGEMKYRFYRMLGMKIGDNTLVGGTIMDPCLTKIGNNCTIGLFAVLYGHIHDYEKEKMYLDKIKIGNNVVIGAGAIIMPGANIEDNVKVAAGSVVKKGQNLKKGRIYGGIPAKEVKKKN